MIDVSAFRESGSEPEVLGAEPPPEPTVLNVRYRAGVVGERSRVVHAAAWTPRGVLITLCGMPLDPSLIEESSGMPCMRCVRIAAERSSQENPAIEDGT